LSQQTLTFVSGLIRTHRKQLGSVWRKLNPGQQALLVLVYLRKGEPFAEVGAGFPETNSAPTTQANGTTHAPRHNHCAPDRRMADALRIWLSTYQWTGGGHQTGCRIRRSSRRHQAIDKNWTLRL
jgi:hypothetical protein